MLFPLIFACTGSVPEPDPETTSSTTPEECLSISASMLDYGELFVLFGESALREVVLSSTCSEERIVAEIALSVETPEFFLTQNLSGTVVQAGSTLNIPVHYAPTDDGADAVTLTISSDDPVSPSLSVALTGTGLAPVLSITPEIHDFGTIPIGCEIFQEITLNNIGGDDLSIDDFSFSADSGELSFSSGESDALNGPLPWSLAPGESTDVYLEYYPLDAIPDDASLLVFSTDPQAPTLQTLAVATGALNGENTDVFEQPASAPVDILFAVDKSCSLDDEIQEFANSFDSYVDALARTGVDYRVGVIVQDSGAIYGDDDYIDESNADDAVDIAREMLSASEGGYTEMAFTLLSNGIGENDVWFRDDARLHLIGFSDEPEQSTYSYSYYVSYFQSLKDDPDDIVISAIGGDYPGGCNIAQPYTGMYEATVATGGSFLSICMKDWDAGMDSLGESVGYALKTFKLSMSAVPESVTVSVDTAPVTAGWQYDDNAVVFDNGSIPEAGAIVEISYAIRGDCDD